MARSDLAGAGPKAYARNSSLARLHRSGASVEKFERRDRALERDTIAAAPKGNMILATPITIRIDIKQVCLLENSHRSRIQFQNRFVIPSQPVMYGARLRNRSDAVTAQTRFIVQTTAVCSEPAQTFL